MVRGARRRHNPNIPAHIDQEKLPQGIYFDHRKGAGVWYTLHIDEGGNRRRKNVASAKALMSDLHRITEERSAADRGSLQWLVDEFARSEKYKSLSAATRADYDLHAAVLCTFPTKLGKPLGALSVEKFTAPVVQRVIDKIAAAGTPAKAAHCLRYLRRLLNWGANRGHCTFILPSHVIEMPAQRTRRRLPSPAVQAELVRFAFERGKRRRGEKGAVAPYLWAAMEIAYLCRLRGIEVATLSDAQIVDIPDDGSGITKGLQTDRRKGSRDNIVRLTARLRVAVEALQARRNAIWEKKKTPVPLAAERRSLIVAAHGGALSKSSLDTAFQRMITLAIADCVISENDRFGLHDLKRRGITDTKGTRADKKEGGGHKSDSMLDVYDFSLPIVNPAAE